MASRAESMNGGSSRISSSMFSFSAAIEAVIASESSASCTIWPCRWSSDRMTTARLRVSSARSWDWSAAASERSAALAAEAAEAGQEVVDLLAAFRR